MTQSLEEDAKALQRDVQRLLGRCLLRLQQYEHLLKAIIADHDVSGAVRDFAAILAARADRTARKTLGTLVGDFTGSFLVSGESDCDHESVDSGTDVLATVSLRMGMRLSETDFLRTKDELKALVKLRNDLVHHFIDQHDLWSGDGCRKPQEALTADYEQIDQCYVRLLEWSNDMDRTKLLFAEYAQSDEFRVLVLNSGTWE